MTGQQGRYRMDSEREERGKKRRERQNGRDAEAKLEVPKCIHKLNLTLPTAVLTDL